MDHRVRPCLKRKKIISGVKHGRACLQAQHLVGQKQEDQPFETKLDCIEKFHPKEKSTVDKNYSRLDLHIFLQASKVIRSC